MKSTDAMPVFASPCFRFPVFASPARDWLFAAMADADPGEKSNPA
jgi:hypothetical protein